MIDLTYIRSLISNLSGSKLNGRFGEWKFVESYGRKVYFALSPTEEMSEEDWDSPLITFTFKGSGLQYTFSPGGYGSPVDASAFVGARWSGLQDEDTVTFFELADAVLQEVENEDKHEIFNHPGLAGGKSNHKYGTNVQKVSPSEIEKSGNDQPQPSNPEPKTSDWRTMEDDKAIYTEFRKIKKPTQDDILDLYKLGQTLRSNRLITLAKSFKLESRKMRARMLVNELLSLRRKTS